MNARAAALRPIGRSYCSGMISLALMNACLLTVTSSTSLPIVELTHDNTRIDSSCLVRIKPGTVIADTDGNGVIQIERSGITIEFESESQLLRPRAKGSSG